MDAGALSKLDQTLRREAATLTLSEPLLAGKLTRLFDQSASTAAALSRLLASLLACQDVSSGALQALFDSLHAEEACLEVLAEFDLRATLRRDPASRSPLRVFLYHKGFHALQTHRAAHLLWTQGRHHLACHLQSRASCVFGVDIHPACRVGHSAMLDHATGIVIGETCVIADGVSILQGVTLGGTGKERGDRHPKIADGVLIGAGATLLGAIHIGEGAKIGAGSVVLSHVPAHRTVVGVPARVVGPTGAFYPAEEMDHSLALSDDTTPYRATKEPLMNECTDCPLSGRIPS